jgi:hypothetical protein
MAKIVQTLTRPSKVYHQAVADSQQRFRRGYFKN